MPGPDSTVAEPPTAFLVWIHLCWSVRGPECMRVGPLSAEPRGGVCTPTPFTRRPAQWTSTNGISASLFHRSQHTGSYTARDREGLQCQPQTGHTEEVNGTFHSVTIFQRADLMSYELLQFQWSQGADIWYEALLIHRLLVLELV